MYFCPHPRRYHGNGQGRGPTRQVTPPRDRPQAQPQVQPVEQPQILRRPPQAAATIPPLPETAGERAVNVIQLETKGKEKMKEPEVMPIQKARLSEEVIGPLASMDTEEEGTSKGKKRKSRASTRRKITIKYFPLGSKEEPYALADMCIIPSQGEGYPIILGRPWLIAMNARQDWEKGTLVLKPPGQKPGKVVVYNMKSGRQEFLEVENFRGK